MRATRFGTTSSAESANIPNGVSLNLPFHPGALDRVRKAHEEDDLYPAYMRTTRGPERPGPSVPHVTCPGTSAMQHLWPG